MKITPSGTQNEAANACSTTKLGSADGEKDDANASMRQSALGRLVVCRLLSSKAMTRVHHYLGFPYVALTLYLSVRFLIASASTLSNDLFWPNFNTSHGATYVANAFNTLLPGRFHQRPVQLTSAEFALYGPMQDSLPHIHFSSTYARTILLHRINTPMHVISSLRRVESAKNIMFRPTQFCWVDFDRNFSLAHTAKRAERCLAHETTNGAVYLESYLRNFYSKGFLSVWETAFANGIETPLQESAEGTAFVATLHAIWDGSISFSIDQELAYWQSKGIEHFTMQWGNMFVPGVTEQIEFVGALGRRVIFPLKSEAANDGPRTSNKLYWLPASDLWAVDDNTTSISGMSLVRGTSRFYENFNITMEQVVIADGTVPWPLTPKDELVRKTLGPFGSIDAKQVLFPESLLDLVMNTSRVVNTELINNPQVHQEYELIPRSQWLSVFPSTWRDSSWGYLGGNPLCSNGAAVNYVQKMVDYMDTCVLSIQEGMSLTRLSLVSSFLAVGNPTANRHEAICARGTLDKDACLNALNTVGKFINASSIAMEDQARIRSLAAKARADILRANPELIQFVVNNSNTSHRELLRQPVMSADLDDPWNLFGWWYAIEWATGLREVIRLEGDDGELVLVSNEVQLKLMDLRGSEVPSSMAFTFLRIVQYTTVVSIVCACFTLVYAIANKGNIAGENLLKFGRVIGAVWIGRPMLLVRGIVAISMISTGNVLLKLDHSLTRLDLTRKRWYMVIIAAGESCWLSYVTTDILATVTQGYTFHYAPLSSLLVHIVNSLVDFIRPFEYSAELDLQCEMNLFYVDITCMSGTVAIGSLPRFILVCAISVGITLLTFLVMRVTVDPVPGVEGGNVLLSGIAKEVFNVEGWVHEGRWYLDKASAFLTGLVTIQVGRHSRVLDIKSWTLLYLKSTRLYDVQPNDDDDDDNDEDDVEEQEHLRGMPAKLRYAMALTLGFDSKRPTPHVPRQSDGHRSSTNDNPISPNQRNWVTNPTNL